MEFLRSKPPKFYYALLLVFLILNCFNMLRSDAKLLPQEEVETLQTIATKLQSRYWTWASITNTSCALFNGFDSINSRFTNNIFCDCTFNNGTVCHVTNIWLDGLYLRGVLPVEFGNLTFLRVLTLSQNYYVSGTIPESLAQIPLVTLALSGNRMNGSISAVIGDITTLEELDLENNYLEGPLPGNLGNLNRLRRMRLSGNFFTESIPETFSNLKNLTEFTIQGNSLSGKIPDLIGNWSKITILDMQGTSMSGPIPSSISQLKNLEVLRISDLNGPSSSFPNLQDMKYLSTLILRNCILTGPIPPYIGNFTRMGILDLSNNRLSGKIPKEIERLIYMKYMFLTNNSLNGTISNWILNNENYFDISYNNFSKFYEASSKQQSNVSLVSIQGNEVLKDFNIVKEAEGVGKGITRDFDDITVNSSTLEIHLYWLGKGTTAIPDRGVYGPLISAITVTPNYKPPENSIISSRAVVGIVAGVAVIVLLILGVLWWKGCLQRKEVENVEVFLKNTGSFAPKRYSYSNVKRMTNSFKDEIGKGGFGCVYKGKLNDDRLVAVKILNNSKGKNGEDFMNELSSISRTSHVNIVTLLGFCFDGSHKALIYEFMPNGSLEKFIYDEIPMKSNRQLGWETLYKIAIGIARGLEYLHRGCNTRILHFDIKPHNILLDNDFCPKITDFGLAKLCPKRESVVSMLGTRGTAGYTAPEVYCRNIGEVSHKVDVYSFGMMVLEMVGGRKNINVGVGMDHTSQIYFPHWIYNRIESNSELGLRGVEIIMDEEENEKARKMILVSLWCIQTDPSNRPPMSRVLEMLEGKLESLQIPPKPFLSSPSRAPPDSSTMKVSN